MEFYDQLKIGLALIILFVGIEWLSDYEPSDNPSWVEVSRKFMHQVKPKMANLVTLLQRILEPKPRPRRPRHKSGKMQF